MVAKQLKFGKEAREAIAVGVKMLADAVAATLGPQGENVIYQPRKQNPRITKDGVTVAKEIRLEDPFADKGCQLIREVAARTVIEAGDGTTTATVLARGLFDNGLELLDAGSKAQAVKRGIDKAAKRAVEILGTLRTTFEVKDHAMIRKIALISTNGDEALAEMVADAMAMVGLDGIVTVQEGTGRTSTLETVRGMRFGCSYLSPYFVTDPEKMVVEMDKVRVFVTDAKLTRADQLMPVVKAAHEKGEPLLVVAGEVTDQALAFLQVNKVKGGMPIAAVRAPFLGERRKDLLKDLCALTGATFVTGDAAVRPENVKADAMGYIDSLKIDRDDTTIIGPEIESTYLEERIAHAKAAIEAADNDDERQFQRARLASLAGGIGVIRVGGQTELEVKEKRDRLDDALHAARAAMEEGIVPGGGIALLRVSNQLMTEAKDQLPDESEEAGYKLLSFVLRAPFMQIVKNAGEDPATIGAKLARSGSLNAGWNAATYTYVDDMVEAGIVDPAKVTRVALQNAASIAGLLLTTHVVVVDVPEEKGIRL